MNHARSAPAGRPLRPSSPSTPATTGEPALRDELYRLQAILDCTEDAVWIRDLGGAYLYANAAGSAAIDSPAIGSPGRAALGQAGEMPQGPLAGRLAALDDEVRRSRQPVEAELALDVTGRQQHYHLVKHPFVSPSGELTGIITRYRDVTERKELEAALTAQNEQLRILDVMKTDFVNTVSHELRTPLTSILAYGEFMEDRIGGELTGTQSEFLGHILDATRQLQRLVDNLLDFASSGERPLRLALEDTDLRACLAEMIASFTPQALG
ncbi:MAG: histidine kinase dimerization/phospho-acceptor domain-containing protein, partial [Candidatus Sericytochromatia bacterium]